MEISKKIYIKGSDPLIRLHNLQKLADEYYAGNFSAMVNDAINRLYNLDPMTGEQLTGKSIVSDHTPPWPQRKKPPIK